MAGKVLVIDDSLMVRQQVTRALSEAGFQVTTAADGVQGLERLAEEVDTGAIVCDVNMPRMNGIELLERLSAQGRKVPVLMFTTDAQPDLMKRARMLGAKGWVLKPFKAEVLIAAMKKLTS